VLYHHEKQGAKHQAGYENEACKVGEKELFRVDCQANQTQNGTDYTGGQKAYCNSVILREGQPVGKRGMLRVHAHVLQVFEKIGLLEKNRVMGSLC